MPTFGQLAEVHALVPPYTPLMACIATATKSVKKDIIDSLEMPAWGTAMHPFDGLYSYSNKECEERHHRQC